MHFQLAPRSMTLDDLELEFNLFSSFKHHYLTNSTHYCHALTFAPARLSCQDIESAVAGSGTVSCLVYLVHAVLQ